MKLKLSKREIRAFMELQDMLKEAGTPPDEFFSWIAAKLTNVHGESPNVDYVQKLTDYSNRFAKIQNLLEYPQ